MALTRSWIMVSLMTALPFGNTGPSRIGRTAQELFQSIRDEFDMNVNFQLRKLGLANNDRVGVANNSRCYGELGCLDVTEDWYGITRPVNALPQDRHIINTRFLLTTRKSFRNPIYLNSSSPMSVLKSTYNASNPTKLIIHGFLDNGLAPWVGEMTEGLLNTGDFNVIAVDWSGGSAVMYQQAAGNTRVVGLEIAYLVKMLVNRFDANVSDFHIIGHSLGSHIAGYAGEHLRSVGIGVLGRISALDPAKPLFQFMPEFVRLDPSDAAFVDVIHTDANSILMFGYGMEQPCGHVDFYPNGGMDQPGCSLMDLPVSLNSMSDPDRAADSVGRHLVACSHMRAVRLYIESLREQDCVMIARECTSYEEFQKGLCFSCGPNSEHCALLGYRAIEYQPIVEKYARQNIRFYLNTAKDHPHCQFHYLLELHLANPNEAERWVQGYLKVNLYGSEGEMTDLDLTQEAEIYCHGDSIRFFFSRAEPLGSPRQLEVGWLYQGDFMNPRTYCVPFYCNSSLYLTNNATFSAYRTQESARFIHGGQTNFLLALDKNLGRVDIVNAFWLYDHELDPLDLTKMCVLLCSDHFFVEKVVVRRVVQQEHHKPVKVPGPFRPKDDITVICGDSNKGYSDIKSGEWKLFYKSCFPAEIE